MQVKQIKHIQEGRFSTMTSYEKGKEKARELAMEYQRSFFDGKCWYWSELAEAYADFSKLGKKYGLLREFRENGII